MINLTIIKLNLALKVEAPPKPTTESSVNEKKFYEDLEYFNRSSDDRGESYGGFHLCNHFQD